MTAMGVDRFVVTLRHAADKKQAERRWHKDQVMHSMAWLKRMNARGYDVLIRPDGEHGLVLLEGLSKTQLDILRQRGFGPAVAVDIDRQRYQAWIKLSDLPISEQARQEAARGLEKGIGLPERGETNETGSRLAGFTNRSENFKNDRPPYTLVTEAVGKVAPAAQAYLRRIQAETTKEIAQQEKLRNKSLGRSR